jgi:murein DD-endopeptidase MepM/ murein hydrolase activator NlpD
MGQRFRVWLGDDISHDGNGYQPGPVFSVQDVENVKKCQRLMGDLPDGWFGPRQWAKLLAAPPRTAGTGIPVDGLRITQHFGVLNARYAARKHTGVDFGASGDDAIRCVAAGTVVTTDCDRDGWGNRVIVKHANDRYSWYCHLASRAVDVGDWSTEATSSA